jgi:nucleoside-diphosphate-sugar epimerase
MQPSLSASPALLVTGGAGLVGSRVTRLLLERGARVVVADDLSAGGPERLRALEEAACLRRVDVSAPRAFSDLLQREGPFDTIIHLAARVGVRRVLSDPEGCRREHLDACSGLIEALAACDRVPRVISVSTSEVYSESSRPLSERSPVRSTDGIGRWAYAASKRAVELALDEASSRGGWSVAPLHLRLFNVVGPDQDAESGMVLPTFVRCALTGEALPIHGSGEQVRTLGHVQDVAEDIVRLALGRELPVGALNLGGDLRCTVLELATRVAQLAGRDLSCLQHVDPTQTLDPRFEEVQHRVPDLTRARALGLADHRRNLDEVIGECLQWAEQETLRTCASPAS